MSPTQRRIQIRARDANNALLPGTVFSWSEGGADRGRIDPSEGHATLQPTQESTIVEVFASYDGVEQRRRLAVDQNLVEFRFDKANAPSLTPTPATTVWRNPAVIAALVAAVPVLIVGYWQFGWKFWRYDPVEIVLYLKDAETQTPIAAASVSIEGAGLQSPVLSDSEGRAVFRLEKGSSQTLTLVARARNYKHGTISVSESSQQVNLLLHSQKVQLPAPTPAQLGTGAKSSAVIDGTWEVILQGDLTHKRVRSGTLDMTGRPDGRLGLKGRLELDGSQMQISGEASRQRDRLFVEFDGTHGSERWKGNGQWDLAVSRLTGYITDAKGEQVALTLRRP